MPIARHISLLTITHMWVQNPVQNRSNFLRNAVKYRHRWQVEANCCTTQVPVIAGLYATSRCTPKMKRFAFGTRGCRFESCRARFLKVVENSDLGIRVEPGDIPLNSAGTECGTESPRRLEETTSDQRWLSRQVDFSNPVRACLVGVWFAAHQPEC
jgi:hypothetical protein